MFGLPSKINPIEMMGKNRIFKENSINEAAKKLFVSQPSLTAALKSLEQEIGFDIFLRNKTGISLTVKGTEFLGYAKSVVEQYDILDAKYISKNNIKRTFHVSMQHYTFAVNAFVEVINQYGISENSCNTSGCRNEGCGGNGSGCNGSSDVISRVGLISDCRCVVCKKIGFQAQKQFEKKLYLYLMWRAKLMRH